MSFKKPKQLAGTARQGLTKSLGILALASVFSMDLAGAATTPPVTLHTVNLGWDVVPDAGITGYKIYVGTQSQQYTESYDTGFQTTFSASGREFGKTYYFVVTAIGSTGLESVISDQLAVTVAPPPLPVGGQMVSNGSGQPGLQWTFPRSAMDSSPAFIVQASSDLVNWTVVDTVLPGQSTGGDAQTLQFNWPVAITGNQKFYRLTARNWMGESTLP